MSQQQHPNGETLEKDFSNDHEHLHSGMDESHALKKIRTAGSISITPELFEKLYLSPQNLVKGDLRKTFGNPTPVALIGFLISLSPLSCDLMGFRGTTNGVAGTATYFFFGGVMMILGGVGEFIMGNTFPSVVFTSFGAFWLSFGGTLQPFYNAYGGYSPDPTKPALGLQQVPFQSGFAFWLLSMGLLCFFYMILSLRTNAVFFGIFACLVVAFPLLAATYWHMASGNMALAMTLQITGGAFLFICCALGWWIFMAIMLAVMEFPFQLPVGDLSKFIKPASSSQAASDQERADNAV